jgi:DNA-directed RNA polymerase subunit beta'
MQDDLVKKGVKNVEVRTPLNCNAPEGVCVFCFGLKEDGQLPVLGDAVGIRSSQALTEPLTQLALSAKHGGGVLKKKKPAFLKLRQLMHAPENFPDGATLSLENGTISKIEKSPDGGKKIFVNDKMHYVQPNVQVYAKVGDKVEKGHVLSDGLVNPKQLVDLKGVVAGREYMSNVIRSTYAENGFHGHPKIFETVSRSLINHGRVEDPGDHPLVPEQIVRWNQFQTATQKMSQTLDGVNAVGWRLSQDTNGLRKDTLITDDNVDKVAHMKSLSVYKNPIKMKPFMLSSERSALHKDDFISSMGYRNIKQIMEQAVSEMQSAPLHTYNPITPYVHGRSFGQGPEGKY